jgi:hypothetical protein
MKRVFGPPHDFRTDRLAAGGDNAQLPGDRRDGLVPRRTHQPQRRRGRSRKLSEKLDPEAKRLRNAAPRARPTASS